MCGRFNLKKSPKSQALTESLGVSSDQLRFTSAWLDPMNTDVEQFTPLLEPRIRFAERVTPIDRPSKWHPIGDPWVIP